MLNAYQSGVGPGELCFILGMFAAGVLLIGGLVMAIERRIRRKGLILVQASLIALVGCYVGFQLL